MKRVILKENAEGNREMVCHVSEKRKFMCENMSIHICIYIKYEGKNIKGLLHGVLMNLSNLLLSLPTLGSFALLTGLTCSPLHLPSPHLCSHHHPDQVSSTVSLSVFQCLSRSSSNSMTSHKPFLTSPAQSVSSFLYPLTFTVLHSLK